MEADLLSPLALFHNHTHRCLRHSSRFLIQVAKLNISTWSWVFASATGNLKGSVPGLPLQLQHGPAILQAQGGSPSLQGFPELHRTILWHVALNPTQLICMGWLFILILSSPECIFMCIFNHTVTLNPVLENLFLIRSYHRYFITAVL